MSSVVFNEPLEQFVVEIPGKGYAVRRFPAGGITLTQNADEASIDDMQYVRELIRLINEDYDRLGLSVVASTARVLRRTVTLTRSDWEVHPYL